MLVGLSHSFSQIAIRCAMPLEAEGRGQSVHSGVQRGNIAVEHWTAAKTVLCKILEHAGEMVWTVPEGQ